VASCIVEQCRADLFDLQSIEDAAAIAGNLAIPIVAALTQKVAAANPEAAGFVHWGATSQDILDTGLVLQLRKAVAATGVLIQRLGDAVSFQTRAHQRTILAGRTWLQHGSPVTLGAKLAATLTALDRDRARIREMGNRLFAIQFGGAVGNLAALGTRGVEIAAGFAQELELSMPATPWHTQRDRLCECATVLGIANATAGKLARDVSLMAQTEVGELNEPAAAGRGGSSTLPQKRNPVGCAIALASAVQVPGLVATMLSASIQEHERGLGNWPAEWETLPKIVVLTGSSLAAMGDVIAGLEVDSARMSANMAITRGQIFAESVQTALAPVLGRGTAHKLVAELVKVAQKQRRDLSAVIASDTRVTRSLSERAMRDLFDPHEYLGSTDAFIRAAL
jgi:3-carboxy-cis,cis-muconate cycloisomerase